MSLMVKKFGGSSVANAERVFNVANIIIDDYKKGNDVVVVVSAQGDTTDDLIEKAKEINPDGASKREMDMLLAAGEQISIALLAMAIEKLGYPVVSLLGWQAGFKTNSAHGIARIKRVDSERIRNEKDCNCGRFPGRQQVRQYHNARSRRFGHKCCCNSRIDARRCLPDLYRC